MIDIDLQAVANQELSIQLDDSRYTLTVKEAGGVMCASLVRDDVTLLDSARLVANSPLIPYDYLQLGNFVFLTQDDELPYFDQFGITQFLVYVSPDEVAQLQGT